MRPKKQVVKNIETFDASAIIPLSPQPIFNTNTSNMKLYRGGFVDDAEVFHKAPKRSTQPFREAVRLGGTWYWAAGLRNRNKELLVPDSLLSVKSKQK